MKVTAMDPNETIKTREITVTAENLQQVARDILMSPTELAIMYMTYKKAGKPLVIVLMEADNG